MRLIDADEAYKVLTDYYHQRTEIQHKALKEAIERVPTIEAEPIKHGHWRADETIYTTGEVWCSVCRTLYYIGDLYDVGGNDLPNYCPHCGAKMDDEEVQI